MNLPTRFRPASNAFQPPSDDPAFQPPPPLQGGGGGVGRGAGSEAVGNSREVCRPRLQPAAIVDVLASLWSAAFTTDPRERRPLKVGIHVDIEAAACGALTKREIHAALGWYVRGGSYLWRMQRPGAERIGLDGKPAGTVTDIEAEHARARLAALKAKRRPITKPSRGADAGATAAPSGGT